MIVIPDTRGRGKFCKCFGFDFDRTVDVFAFNDVLTIEEQY